jgi:hypothetical protein
MEGQRKVHLNALSPDTQNTFTLDVLKFMEGQRKVHLNSLSPDTQNTFTLDVLKFKCIGANGLGFKPSYKPHIMWSPFHRFQSCGRITVKPLFFRVSAHLVAVVVQIGSQPVTV